MSLVKSFLRSGISQRHDEAGLENVYAVHGAFLIFNGPFLRSVKMEMNEVPFLFGEEIFMAELALKQNQKVIYDGRLKVIHMEHSTTGLFKSPNLVLHLRSSVDLLLRKFF